MWAYVEILLICNFHPSHARNYATTIISKLNNFVEVLAVRVHVDVYMATPALRSLTHETLCDTGHRTRYTFFTTYQPTTTKSDHFKPSILVFLPSAKNHRWKKLLATLCICDLILKYAATVMYGIRCPIMRFQYQYCRKRRNQFET